MLLDGFFFGLILKEGSTDIRWEGRKCEIIITVYEKVSSMGVQSITRLKADRQLHL